MEEEDRSLAAAPASVRWATAVVAALGASAAGGGLGLLSDLVLARLLTGISTPLFPSHVLAYLGVGAALGLAVAVVAGLAGRRLSAAALAAWSFGLLYALPVGERVYLQVSGRPPSLAWAMVTGVGLGYLAFVVALGSVSQGSVSQGSVVHPRDSRGLAAWLAPPPLAPFLAGVCAATGLAVNRFVVVRPLEPAALAADLALVAAVFALAFLARRTGSDGRPGWRAPLAVVGTAALLAVAVIVLRPEPLPTTGPPDPAAGAGTDPSPHLVLLVIDTLRQDVFADVLATTPEGERLRGALGGAAYFTHAVAAAPWTPPSMGTLLTGLYPREHGFVSRVAEGPGWSYGRLSPDAPTLAQRLDERGWWTEAIGSNPILHAETGIARGFDEFRLLAGLTVRLPLLTAMVRLGWIHAEYYQEGWAVAERFEHRFGRVVEACEPLGCRAFFWVHLTDPHHPLHPRPTYEEDLGVVRRGIARRARYRGEVRYAVDRAAEVLEAIERAGAGDETLVVLVSDHGEMLPGDRPGVERTEPEYGHGHVLYEPLLHVPLVIRPPGGLEAPREVEALVSHADVHDTVLDLLGVEAPRIGRDRRTLAPLVRGDAGSAGRSWALFSHPQKGPMLRGIRIGSAKLIHRSADLDFADPDSDAESHSRPSVETWELFDLARDPEETRDLAGADPETARLLRMRLERVWRELGEPEAGSEVPLDEETRRRLEALGYL